MMSPDSLGVSLPFTLITGRSGTEHSTAPCIKEVTDEVILWEKVPKQQEPFTIKMWKYLSSLNGLFSSDGIIDCITDWPACGLYGGFRKAE